MRSFPLVRRRLTKKRSPFLLVQVSHDVEDQATYGPTYLIPISFFHNERRVPGALKTFRLLLNRKIITDPIYSLIAFAFFDDTPLLEEVWYQNASNLYKETYGRDFKHSLYSWDFFQTNSIVHFDGKKNLFFEWLRRTYFLPKYKNATSDEKWKVRLISSSGFSISFYFVLTHYDIMG